MTIVLELLPELEKSLKEAATKAGSQPSDVALTAIQKGLSELRPQEIEHGYKELGEAQQANPNVYSTEK
ncbi:MAG: hypothetical protein ACRCYY_15915 [Trueperaceae bacterium]